ncbi:MAG: MFS transporter [Coriobacteriaceae bacterium]|nr:MFS transporter [Coriobacteriaceae bacterium]
MGINSQQVKTKPKIPLWTRDFILITVANLFIFSGFHMLPSTLPVWVKSLGAADSLIGWVTGVTTISAVLTRPFVGLAVDHFGRRGIFIIGLALMLVTTASFAFFPVVAIVLAIRLLQGVSWAMANTASQTVAADVIPQKRFAEGMGYFLQSSAIALTVAPGLSLYLLYEAGIDAMVAVSSSMFALALVLVLFMRFKKYKVEEKAGLHDKETAIAEAIADPAGMASPVAEPEIVQMVAETNPRKNGILSKLFERRAILPAVIMIFIAAIYGSTMTFLAVLAEERQIDGMIWYFVVYAVVNIVVRPVFGVWVDRVGYNKPMIVGLIGMVLTTLVIWATWSLPMLLLAAFVQAIGLAACFATLQTMAIADVPANRRGTAVSTFFIGFYGGIGFGSVGAGIIAQALGYGNMFLVFTILPVFALILFVVSRHKHGRGT